MEETRGAVAETGKDAPPTCPRPSLGVRQCRHDAEPLLQDLIVARMHLERGEVEQALIDLDDLITAAQGRATPQQPPTRH